MLATIMFFMGIVMMLAASYGLLRTAFQISPVWAILSFLVIPFIIFILKYFQRIRYCLMVFILGLLSSVVSLYGGADQSLKLRQMSDILGISHYPVVSLLRYPKGHVSELPYINMEDNNDAWPVKVEPQVEQVKASEFKLISATELEKHIGELIRIKPFSGDILTGYLGGLDENLLSLSADKLNPKSSFTYKIELLETIEVLIQ